MASAGTGGMELAPLLLAQGLRKKGHQVTIWADPGTFFGKKVLEQKFPLRTFRFRGYLNPSGIGDIRKALSMDKPDVIHLHHSRDLFSVVPALKLSGWKGPMLLTKHVESNVVKKDILHRWLYGRLDRMLACSAFIRDNILRTCPIAPEKVGISFVPVDLERFKYSPAARKKLRRSWGWEKNIVIGMVARITPGKGHDLFLNIAERLLRKDPKVRFRLAGHCDPEEDWYYQELLTLRKKLGLEKVVFFDQHIENVPEFLSAMDLVLHTAKAESFGMAVAEAMACARPVVVRRGGGVAEILEAVPGKARGGVIMENTDPEKWARTLMGLLQTKGLRAKLGGETRKMVLRFGRGLWVDKHIRWYRQLLEGKTPARP